MSLINTVQNRLSPTMGVGEAKAVVLLLFEKLFGFSQTDVLMGKPDTLGDEEKGVMDKCVDRLCVGEPVQYVLGRCDFRGLELHVAPGVLIPRIETEELVGVITDCEKGVKHPKILDIGTGSGCIALALKHEIPDSDVEGWDISEKALKIASGNAARLGLEVVFSRHDILSEATTLSDEKRECYDVIVSNPPYVCDRERAEMQSCVVDYEPHEALFVPDNDPLMFYKAIISFAYKALKSGGGLYFEINREYGKDITSVLDEKGYHDIRLLADQFGNDRMICAKR